jgi:hypothetical protein
VRIVALDPGGTTGIATYDDVNGQGEEWAIWQLGPEEHHAALWRYLSNSFMPFSGNQVIVCESFEFRQNRQRDNINLMSREYIGVVKLFSETHGIPVVFQTAGAGKGFVSDEKLKIMDMWVPGKKHAMDARRHLIYYMVNKQKRLDLIQSWKNL